MTTAGESLAEALSEGVAASEVDAQAVAAADESAVAVVPEDCVAVSVVAALGVPLREVDSDGVVVGDADTVDDGVGVPLLVDVPLGVLEGDTDTPGKIVDAGVVALLGLGVPVPEGVLETLASRVLPTVGVMEGVGARQVNMGEKTDPRLAYGATSAPKKAYDCCVASACTPASL